MSKPDYVTRFAAMTRDELEQHALWMAERLDSIHGMDRQQLVDERDAARTDAREWEDAARGTAEAMRNIKAKAAELQAMVDSVECRCGVDAMRRAVSLEPVKTIGEAINEGVTALYEEHE